MATMISEDVFEHRDRQQTIGETMMTGDSLPPRAVGAAVETIARAEAVETIPGTILIH